MMRPASSGGSVEGTIRMTECWKSGSSSVRVATRKDGVVRSVACAVREVAKVAIRAVTRMLATARVRSLVLNARIQQLIASTGSEVQRRPLTRACVKC